MKALCINNGKYTGTIDSVEMYEAFRDGKIDFNPNVKSKIENITIPYDLFVSLMELDKDQTINGEICETNIENTTIDPTSKIYSAYEALVEVRDNKDSTIDDFTIAMTEAIGYLGEVLDD